MLCKDKLDSVLIRLKEEVQKICKPRFTVTGISATSPCLDPDGILQKVNQKGRESLLYRELCFRGAAEHTCSFPCRQAGNSTKIRGHLILQVTSSSQGRQGWQPLIRLNPVLRPLKTNLCRTGQIQLNIACKDSKAYFSITVFWQVEVVDRDCVLPAATIQECCLTLEGSFSFVVVVFQTREDPY